jgi:hypothetical protein
VSQQNVHGQRHTFAADHLQGLNDGHVLIGLFAGQGSAALRVRW